MSEFLVVRLDPPPRETASWVPVDQTGALLGPVTHGALSDAAPAAAGRQVIVLVPALDALRVTAEVPVKAGGKLLQALPFAIEEQVAEDVENLHFAAGGRADDGRVPVVVVRRELMDAWQARLAAAGLRPLRMHAEADAVGLTPNTATLLLQEDSVVLAEADGSLTGMDPGGLDAMLDLWMARREASAGDPGPLHLVVYGSPAALGAHETTFDRLRPGLESLELRKLAEGALPRLAGQIVTAPGINMLQGAYAQRSSLLAFWPAWRLAASLLIAVGALALAAQAVEIRKLRSEAAALDTSIDQAFHYVFPDAGPIQDARAELSSRLRQLGDRSAGASHEFLDALNVIARAVGTGAGARIEGVNYRAGTMELRVRAPSVESLDRIQQAVTQTGSLKAQIQSANASGNEVVGRLQISRAGG
jgi:general secretion pathway protein L